MSNRKHRSRRKRRTGKQVLRYGPKAKRPHTHISGRTGQIWFKQTRSKKCRNPIEPDPVDSQADEHE